MMHLYRLTQTIQTNLNYQGKPLREYTYKIIVYFRGSAIINNISLPYPPYVSQHSLTITVSFCSVVSIPQCCIYATQYTLLYSVVFIPQSAELSVCCDDATLQTYLARKHTYNMTINSKPVYKRLQAIQSDLGCQYVEAENSIL